MRNPNNDYPLSSFVAAFHTLLGSFFLFWAACVCGYLLTTFDRATYYSVSEYVTILPIAWVFPLMFAAMSLVGLPFAFVHLWTIYHLIQTDDSRLKLFFIALANQSAVCIAFSWATAFSESWVRGCISIAVLVGLSLIMRKYRLFNDAR